MTALTAVCSKAWACLHPSNGAHMPTRPRNDAGSSLSSLLCCLLGGLPSCGLAGLLLSLSLASTRGRLRSIAAFVATCSLLLRKGALGGCSSTSWLDVVVVVQQVLQLLTAITVVTEKTVGHPAGEAAQGSRMISITAALTLMLMVCSCTHTRRKQSSRSKNCRCCQ
jgi:hypothetical protein